MTVPDRREFLKRLAAGTAYVAPVVYSLAAPVELGGQAPTGKGHGGGGGHGMAAAATQDVGTPPPWQQPPPGATQPPGGERRQ